MPADSGCAEPDVVDTAPVVVRPPTHPRRLAFLGTPDAAVPALRALVEAGFPVAMVVTRPDTRRGRGSTVTPSPVKAAALELGLPVTDRLDDILELDIDLGVVVAYGRLIPTRVLERIAMVNLHFSLLPRWRGAAPVQRALLAGDAETGVCVMDVAPELDTGGVHARRSLPIDDRATAASLTDRLSVVGAELLVDTLRAGLADAEPQRGEVTHAAKITAEDLRIDWRLDAGAVDRLVRVGGAWTTFRGARLKIHRVQPVSTDATEEPGSLHELRVVCGRGQVELIEVQPEGRARQSASSWRNGAHCGPDDRLGA